jgi:hypothetical protein
VIGPEGGSIAAYGIEVDVPPGALAMPVALSVSPSTAPPPAGYVLLSSVYYFAPEGTAFAVPVAVHFQTTGMEAEASAYWSRATGGYDPITTTWSGTTATASVTHFSAGFVGLVASDGGVPDAAADGATDAAAESGELDGAAEGDADATLDGGIDAALDGAIADDASDADASAAIDSDADGSAEDADSGD